MAITFINTYLTRKDGGKRANISGGFESDGSTSHVGRYGTYTIKRGSTVESTWQTPIVHSGPVGGPDVPFYYHTAQGYSLAAHDFADGKYTLLFSYTAGGKTETADHPFEIRDGLFYEYDSGLGG